MTQSAKTKKAKSLRKLAAKEFDGKEPSLQLCHNILEDAVKPEGMGFSEFLSRLVTQHRERLRRSIR